VTGPRDIAETADLYALGLLEPAEAAAVEARMAREPALAAAVAAARDRLLPLDLAAPPEAPSPGLWARIEAAIGPAPAPETDAMAEAAGLPPVPPAPLPPPFRKPRRKSMGARAVRAARAAAARPSGRRALLGLWAGLAALALLAAGFGARGALAPAPLVVAVLLDAQGTPVAIVEDFGNARARVTPLAEVALPQGRTFEVWTLPDPATGPVSLGTLARAASATLRGPELPRPRREQLYEITIEPAGGSPTGRPTGPIVGKGFAKVPL
jgi:anti-sigma-K factor RskA